MYNIFYLRNLIQSLSHPLHLPSTRVIQPKVAKIDGHEISVIPVGSAEADFGGEKIPVVQEYHPLNQHIKPDKFCRISYRDPYSALTTQRKVTEVFSFRNEHGALISRGKHRGFHGTSLEALKRVHISQLFSKELIPLDKRTYYDAIGTSIPYSLRVNYRDFFNKDWKGTICETEAGKCLLVAQPVILAISSDEFPNKNDPNIDTDLHPWYHYFSGKNTTFIDGMWVLHPTLRERDGSESSIRAIIGVGMPEGLIAAASRSLKGSEITFY